MHCPIEDLLFLNSQKMYQKQKQQLTPRPDNTEKNYNVNTSTYI